jgi:hypothetical protein
MATLRVLFSDYVYLKFIEIIEKQELIYIITIIRRLKKEMNTMLYNNGYVVKGLYHHEIYSQQWKTYLGIGSYTSWPLKYLNCYAKKWDEIEELSLWRNEGYFLNPRYREKNFPRNIEFVADIDFIKNYMELCDKEGIKTLIMRMDSEIFMPVKTKELKIVEVLGWDCVATEYFTLLYELCDKSFGDLSLKLNKHYLFDNIDDVKEFISIRESLIDRGIELENAFEPTPGRLSIVEL